MKSVAALFLLSVLWSPLAQGQMPAIETVAEITQHKNLTSHAKRDIDVFVFDAESPEGAAVTPSYRFLVQGGLHGNERLTAEFVIWLAKRYARNASPLNRLPRDQVAFDFVPVANPDGFVAADRYNGREVNLNRNFSVLWGVSSENPGQHHSSEPETKAILAMFKKRQYTSAVDVHGYTNWIVAPTSPAKLKTLGGNPDKELSKYYPLWYEALEKEMSLLPGYAMKTAGGLGDGGAFEDWAYWEEGTFAYCLELKSRSRFATPYRRSFSDITQNSGSFQIDLFKQYEMFIYRMFDHAIKIKQSQPEAIVVSPKEKSGPRGTH